MEAGYLARLVSEPAWLMRRGTDDLAEQGGEVGCDECIFFDEVLVHVFAVLAEVDDAVGKVEMLCMSNSPIS